MKSSFDFELINGKLLQQLFKFFRFANNVKFIPPQDVQTFLRIVVDVYFHQLHFILGEAVVRGQFVKKKLCHLKNAHNVRR